MSVDVTMPKLGLTMTSGVVERWLKAPGDPVVRGEPLLEVSTDKINYQVDAPASGVVTGVLARDGEEYACGAVLGTIGGPADRIVASPAARRLARERGIALGGVAGSGPRGRVTLDDVRRARGNGSVHAAPPAPAARAAIARKMTDAARLPLAQVESAVRVDALRALMQRRGDFGWTAYAVRACGLLLRTHEALRIDASTGAPFPACDVGMAVDTPHGLIVPVVRAADTRALADIERDITRLAASARARSLGAADVGGACFSVSNLGPQGAQRVAPIVDPPQTAILGMGAVTRAAAVEGDAVVPAWLLSLVVSFDHRFVDGAPAARFLSDLAAAFADPGRLL